MIINEILEALSPEEGSLDVLVVDNEELGNLVTVNDTLGVMSADENESLSELIPENARFVSGQDIFLYVPRAKTNTRYGLVKYNARDFSIDSTGVLSLLLDASQIQDYFAEIRGGTREETVAATPPVNLKTLNQKDELLASEITTLYSRDSEIYGTLGRQGTVLSEITLTSLHEEDIRLQTNINSIISDSASPSSTSHTYSASKITRLIADAKMEGLHFVGFIGSTVGESYEGNPISKEGALWYQSDDTNTPESPEEWTPIYKCVNGQWVIQQGYTPNDFDIWKNVNMPDTSINCWWYFEGSFEVLDFNVDMSLYYTKVESDERYKSKFTYGSYISEVNKVLTIENMSMPTSGLLTSFVKGDSDLESTNVQDAIKELETNIDAQYFVLSSRSNWIDNDITPLRAGDYSVKSDGIYESVSDGDGGYVWQLQTIDLSSLLSKSSANHNLVTDISFIVDNNTGYLSGSLSLRNLNTGVTSSSPVSIPVATSEHDGIMPATSMIAISQLDTRISALESGAPSYYVSFPSNTPSQEVLTLLYQTVSGDPDDPANLTTLIDITRNIYYQYFSSVTPHWQGPYTYRYAIASVGNPGIVSSSQQDGQIYVEPVTGVMSLNGYSDIISTFNTLYGGEGRTSIAISQIPDLPASKITSGILSFDRLPVITVAKGGTGNTTFSANKFVISGSSDDGAFREGTSFGDLNTLLVGQGSSTIPVFKTISEMLLVQKDSNGQIDVPLTPTSNTNATSKSYVDSVDANKVDKTTTINGKTLTNDIILTASDVGALSDTTTYVSYSQQTLTTEQQAQARQNIGAGSANATSVLIDGVLQSTINFDSDPQTQIDNKVDKSDIGIYNGIISEFDTSYDTEHKSLDLVGTGFCYDNGVKSSYVVNNNLFKVGTNMNFDSSTLTLDIDTTKVALISNIPTQTSQLTNNSGFITSSSLPTKVSDLQNDSGFITNTVNNLTNYYTKSEIYTQAEVNSLIGAIPNINVEIVQILPTAGATYYFNTSKTIYLVPKSTTQTNNSYDEYICTRAGTEGSYTYAWEKIGDTEIDLSNYYTKTESDNKFALKTTTINGHALTSNITLTASDVGALSSNTTYVSSVNGSSGAVTGIQTISNLVTSFSSTTSNSKYPSEKLVKDSLDAKQDTLSASQLNAVNSGIDSTKVAQIATNTTNIANKVDKISTTQRVYGTDSNGNQTTLHYDSGANAWDIVQRNANSEIYVPTTPTYDNSAVSKAYADTKVSQASTPLRLYGIDSNGNQDLVPFDANGGAWTMALRNGTGNVQVALTPSDNWSATSKQYVDKISQYDFLYQGYVSSGSFDIANITNYKWIILAYKYNTQGNPNWSTARVPAAYIASEIAANRIFELRAVGNAANRYATVRFNTNTNISVLGESINWIVLWGEGKNT